MKNLDKKKVSLALTLAIIIAGFSAVLAAVNLYYNMPMHATIEEKGSLEMYVDESPWINGTDIGWNPGAGAAETKSLEIKNTGNVQLQVIFTVSGLPSGWDLTYNRNGSVVNAGTWLNGTLTLTVPSDVTPATYYWECSIHASS